MWLRTEIHRFGAGDCTISTAHVVTRALSLLRTKYSWGFISFWNLSLISYSCFGNCICSRPQVTARGSRYDSGPVSENNSLCRNQSTSLQGRHVVILKSDVTRYSETGLSVHKHKRCKNPEDRNLHFTTFIRPKLLYPSISSCFHLFPTCDVIFTVRRMANNDPKTIQEII